MALINYECMFIFSPNSYARNPAGAAATVESLVTDNGGTILASRLWNEQKMAYPIRGHRKGAYWLCYFQLESTEIPKFNRAVQLTDQILRHLVIKVDPRLIDSLVAAAKGEALPEEEPEVEASEGEAKEGAAEEAPVAAE